MLYDPKWKEAKVLDEVGEGLLKAAKYIEDHGWCQNTVEDEKGQVCIIGALDYAGLRRLGWVTASGRVTKAVGSNFINWNNHPKRTKQEVINILKQAAYLR